MFDYRINTFLTLCDTMNYRLAAQKLNITQPSVTQHIQYLEKYYDCKLFEYNGRYLHMTNEAVTLKKYALSMNYQENRLKQALRPPKGYSLTIGATKTIGEYVIPGQIVNFLSEPDNSISVIVDNTTRILELLEQGKIDFAIIEGFFDKSSYTYRLYRDEPFVGFCSSDHSFAGKEVSLSELLKQDLIIREEGSGTRTIFEQELAKHNYSIGHFRRVTCIDNFGLLENLVANGCGVTFAYRAAGISNPALAAFTVKDWNITREFNYVCLPDTDAINLIELFEKYI